MGSWDLGGVYVYVSKFSHPWWTNLNFWPLGIWIFDRWEFEFSNFVHHRKIKFFLFSFRIYRGLYPCNGLCTIWCTILQSIQYDEILVGYTNRWLKARFRSISSSRKIVRTVLGTRRSEIITIQDLEETLKNPAVSVKISETSNIHWGLNFWIWNSIEGSTYSARTPRAQRAHF